jgi:hypothetical protein
MIRVCWNVIEKKDRKRIEGTEEFILEETNMMS